MQIHQQSQSGIPAGVFALFWHPHSQNRTHLPISWHIWGSVLLAADSPACSLERMPCQGSPFQPARVIPAQLGAASQACNPKHHVEGGGVIQTVSTVCAGIMQIIHKTIMPLSLCAFSKHIQKGAVSIQQALPCPPIIHIH